MKWLESLLKLFDVNPAGAAPEEHLDISKCPFMNGTLNKSEPSAPGTELVVVSPPVQVFPEPVLTGFAKIQKEYNGRTDILVMSTVFAESLSKEDLEWLDKPEIKVIYFQGDTLINVGVVRAGHTGW